MAQLNARQKSTMAGGLSTLYFNQFLRSDAEIAEGQLSLSEVILIAYPWDRQKL